MGEEQSVDGYLEQIRAEFKRQNGTGLPCSRKNDGTGSVSMSYWNPAFFESCAKIYNLMEKIKNILSSKITNKLVSFFSKGGPSFFTKVFDKGDETECREFGKSLSWKPSGVEYEKGSTDKTKKLFNIGYYLNTEDGKREAEKNHGSTLFKEITSKTTLLSELQKLSEKIIGQVKIMKGLSQKKLQELFSKYEKVKELRRKRICKSLSDVKNIKSSLKSSLDSKKKLQQSLKRAEEIIKKYPEESKKNLQIRRFTENVEKNCEALKSNLEYYHDLYNKYKNLKKQYNDQITVEINNYRNKLTKGIEDKNNMIQQYCKILENQITKSEIIDLTNIDKLGKTGLNDKSIENTLGKTTKSYIKIEIEYVWYALMLEDEEIIRPLVTPVFRSNHNMNNDEVEKQLKKLGGKRRELRNKLFKYGQISMEKVRTEAAEHMNELISAARELRLNCKDEIDRIDKKVYGLLGIGRKPETQDIDEMAGWNEIVQKKLGALGLSEQYLCCF